jgi:hypothetical protein
VQRGSALLEDRSRERIEVMTNLTRVGRTTLDAIQLALFPTLSTMHYTAGITLFLDCLKTNIVIRKFGLELI